MIDHHVVWLHIPVHDAHAVTVVEGLEEFVQVESDVIIRESLKRRKTVLLSFSSKIYLYTEMLHRTKTGVSNSNQKTTFRCKKSPQDEV